VGFGPRLHLLIGRYTYIPAAACLPGRKVVTEKCPRSPPKLTEAGRSTSPRAQKSADDSLCKSLLAAEIRDRGDHRVRHSGRRLYVLVAPKGLHAMGRIQVQAPSIPLGDSKSIATDNNPNTARDLHLPGSRADQIRPGPFTQRWAAGNGSTCKSSTCVKKTMRFSRRAERRSRSRKTDSSRSRFRTRIHENAVKVVECVIDRYKGIQIQTARDTASGVLAFLQKDKEKPTGELRHQARRSHQIQQENNTFSFEGDKK